MIDEDVRTEIEAAAFRDLVTHLQKRTDVQNIDLMLLADFCRNCMSKWLVKAAAEREIELSYEDAREAVYGMPYGEWKAAYQTPVSPEKLAALQGGAKSA